MHGFVCFWPHFIHHPPSLFRQLLVTEDLTDKIWPSYNFDSLLFELTSINIVCLSWLTGGPWKCPKIYSCPFPEYTTGHHEAHRRAASILTATGSGMSFRKLFICTESFFTWLKLMSYSSSYLHDSGDTWRACFLDHVSRDWLGYLPSGHCRTAGRQLLI